MPEHPIFEYISADPQEFYNFELERREMYGYPPYTKLARIVFSHSKEADLRSVAGRVAAALAAEHKGVQLMGPAPAVIFKIKNRYRMSLLVKSTTHRELGALLLHARSLFDKHKSGTMTIKIDRDPYFFL
jgi:primosomal protein N' (replication factor Y)